MLPRKPFDSIVLCPYRGRGSFLPRPAPIHRTFDVREHLHEVRVQDPDARRRSPVHRRLRTQRQLALLPIPDRPHAL